MLIKEKLPCVNQLIQEMHSTAPRSGYWEAELAHNRWKHCNNCKERGRTKFKCPKLKQRRIYGEKACKMQMTLESNHHPEERDLQQEVHTQSAGLEREAVRKQSLDKKIAKEKDNEKRGKDYSGVVKININAMEKEFKSIRENQTQIGKVVQQLHDMVFKHFGKAESL